MEPVSFAAIGECMVELSAREGDLWRMAFAGDTFNAAYYARAVLPADRAVAYVTAVGNDPFSARLQAFIAQTGIFTDRIRTITGRRPGLYAITLTGAERQFTYWRGESAARQMADDEAWLAQTLTAADVLYFSGITLGILRPDKRERLLDALRERRAAGARIAFDPNFRPALWPDREEAIAAMAAAFAVADVALPTFDDEAGLFGDKAPEDTLDRVRGYGTPEIVVKNGSAPCLIGFGEAVERVPAIRPDKVVDTTGAGDSFGGAYLAGRHMGLEPSAAARLGHAAAAQVIGARGALTRIVRADAFKSADLPIG